MAANYAFTRASGIIDKVLVWLHGRRLGIFGDGQTTNNSSLVLDGVTVGSTRTGANSLKACTTGSNGAGGVTVTGTLVGDLVELVVDLSASPPADVSSSFETLVSVAGQVQQISGSNLSNHGLLFFVNPQAAT